jgi:hypothetical protein
VIVDDAMFGRNAANSFVGAVVADGVPHAAQQTDANRIARQRHVRDMLDADYR